MLSEFELGRKWGGVKGGGGKRFLHSFPSLFLVREKKEGEGPRRRNGGEREEPPCTLHSIFARVSGRRGEGKGNDRGGGGKVERTFHIERGQKKRGGGWREPGTLVSNNLLTKTLILLGR